MRDTAPGYNELGMMRRAAIALASLAMAFVHPGCVTLPEGTVDLPITPQAPVPGAVLVPAPPNHPSAEPEPAPSPPKPSLSQLTNRNRPHLEFHGARIYADTISGTEATGNVFVDGRDLHQINRSFPIAVYGDHLAVDPKKERITLSGWPLVQTDSAFIQAQDKDTAIILSADRLARIKGPARYVIGTRDADIFAP